MRSIILAAAGAGVADKVIRILALALGLLVAPHALAETYAPPPERRQAAFDLRKFGDLSIHKVGFDHVVRWRRREIARYDTARTVTVEAVYPGPQDPRFVVLSVWSGAGVCGGMPVVIELVPGRRPTVGPEIGSCEKPRRFWTGTQLIFEDVYGEVTYQAQGTGTRSLDSTSRADSLTRGMAAFRRGDNEAAIRDLWPLRDGMWPEAPYALGRMAESGRGLPRNVRRAREFYVTASALGSAEAAERLARLYERGFGVERSPEVAAAHRRRAEFLRHEPQAVPLDDPATWRLWLGKHPFERFLGRNLFEVDWIAARMAELFAPEERKMLARYQTQGAVEKRDGWLILQGCIPHECTTYHHSIMIEIDGPGIVACVGLMGAVAYDDRTDILAANGMSRRVQHQDDVLAPFHLCDPYGTDPSAARAQLEVPRAPERPFWDPIPSRRPESGGR